MADVLSSGYGPGDPGDRPPPPPRRRRNVVAGVLVAAGAAYLAVHTGGGNAAGPQASDQVRVQPAPDPYRTGAPAREAVYHLDADPGPGPAGLRLLVGGQQPGVLDTGTSRITPLDLPSSRRDVAELDHGGGTITAQLHNPRGFRARGLVIGRGRPAVPIGDLLDLVPLRDGTALGQDCSGAGGTGPCTLTDYTVTGKVRWKRTVGRQLDLVRDTPYGLLVRAYQGDQGGVARLDDPRTGAVKRVIGRTYQILGADDRRMVFQPSGCGSDCALTLSDLSDGASRYLPEMPGSPTVAAFSADGSRVAIGYSGLLSEDPSQTDQRDGYVAVVDLNDSDRWRTVPGLTTGAASTALPVWAPDGQLVLVVPTDGTGGGRVVAWRPGAKRATLLPVRLTGFYGSAGLAAPLT